MLRLVCNWIYHSAVDANSEHSVRPVLDATCNFDEPAVAAADDDCAIAVVGVAVAAAIERYDIDYFHNLNGDNSTNNKTYRRSSCWIPHLCIVQFGRCVNFAR